MMTVGQNRHRCDEQTEEPGTFFGGGGIQACDLLQGDFVHANDGSTLIAF